MNSKFAAYTFAFGLSFGVIADGAVRADTLPQALAYAYSTNPDLNVERALTRATDEGVPIAKSGNRPNIFASGSVTGDTSRARRNNITSGNRSVDGAVGLTITQNVFSGFQTKNSVREAEANVLASRAGLENSVQNILFDAAEVYMNVLQNQALLELGLQNVGFLTEQLKATQDRFDVGETTRTDVAQTRARLSAADSGVNLARANLNSAKAFYRQIIGKEPGTLAPGKSYSNLIPPSQSAAVSLGLVEHPAIISAIYAADAAEFVVKQNEGKLLPTLSVEATGESGFGIDNNDFSNAARIVGRVSIPIYQGGLAAASVRQSKQNLGAQQIQVDVTRASVRAVIVSAWGQLDAAKASIIAAAAQVEASQIALEGVTEEQRVGQRTQLDVLDAQRELIDAQVNLVVAQRDRIVASFALISAVGRLDPQSLRLAVAVYEPSQHYNAVKDKWYGLRTPDGR